MDSLQLFGSPEIHLAGHDAPLPLDWPKGAALLAYLACRPGWQPRHAVAELLRPEADDTVARAYLRRLLYRLRQAFPAMAGLEVEEERIRWAGTSDVQRFEQAVAAGDWEEAIRLQPAPLLAPAPLSELDLLDAQLAEQRSRLRQSLRQALATLIEARRHAGLDSADLMRRLVAEDPMDEGSVRFVQSAAATAAEREVAAQASAVLQEPSGRAGHPPSVSPRVAVPATATPSTPLGRERELDDLKRLIAQPSVRLLTLFGFGGVGKTTLARSLFDALTAQSIACAWVDLVAADSLQTLLDALSAQVGMPAPEDSVEHHLARWLADRELVVFLDNFEQLAEHAPLLANLLKVAPRLRFVVTSREALRLPEEHAVRLEGLAFEGVDSPAARLFARHAARAARQPGAEGAQAVADLVAHLQGLPLAIELAAYWTMLLPPDAILKELRADAEFLDKASAILGGSTRGMHTVLEAGWRRLPGAEQEALCGLSVFMGVVALEQARRVAGVELQVLLRLVDKSLLQRSPAGLRMHPLLRDFVRSRGPAEWLARARQAHARHFLGQLAEAQALHFGAVLPRGSPLLAQVEDVLKAWHFGVENEELALLRAALPALGVLLLSTARYEEAASLCAQAAGQPPLAPLASELAALRAAACVRLGRMQEARAVADAALQGGATGHARSWLEATLARAQWFAGNHAAALDHAQRALQAAPAGDPYLRMHALQESAHARYGLGDIQAGRDELQASLQLAHEHHASYLEARALCHLAALCNGSRQPDEALTYLTPALEIFSELELAYDTAFAQRCRSYSLFLKGERAAQLEAAQASLAMFRSAGYRHELGESTFAVGLAHQASGRPEEAAATYREALPLCLQARNISAALRCIGMLGVLAAPKARAWGVALVCFALAHPELRRPDAQVMRGLLAKAGATEAELAQGARDAAGWTLESVSGRLLGDAVANRPPAPMERGLSAID